MTSVSWAVFRQGNLLRSDGSVVVLIVEQVGELGLEVNGESWLGEGLREWLWERECLAILFPVGFWGLRFGPLGGAGLVLGFEGVRDCD